MIFKLSLGAMVLSLILSGTNPHDYPTWLLEVFPVMIAVPLMLKTRRSFPLTPLLCVLIALHSVLLCYGGHYTYAETPLGFWFKETFHFSRNHYDRLGHLFQGIIPAILSREILLRKRIVDPVRGGWLFFIVVSICLSFSAFYELLEWSVALVLGQGSDAFLGTQGDPWDTQSDMFMAFLGSIMAQVLLGQLHQKQIEKLSS